MEAGRQGPRRASAATQGGAPPPASIQHSTAATAGCGSGPPLTHARLQKAAGLGAQTCLPSPPNHPPTSGHELSLGPGHPSCKSSSSRSSPASRAALGICTAARTPAPGGRSALSKMGTTTEPGAAMREWRERSRLG